MMLSYLKELAQIAGRIALEHFQRVRPSDYTVKGRSDFVSFVDRRIEDELSARIRSHHPGHLVLGEETHGELRSSGPCWIIDPIDGTTNFIRGIPWFAVSIAFCDNNAQPRCAAIIDPVRKELFICERQAGAWLGEGRLQVSDQPGRAGALIHCAQPFRVMDALDDINAVCLEQQRVCGDVRRMGSAALDLAYVAAGRCDAYWELGIWPWDTAAGELLVQCAGGVCSDFRGESGQLLTRRSIIAAATPGLHAELLASVGAPLAHWLDRPPYVAEN